MDTAAEAAAGVLGVHPAASEATIRKAYRARCRRCHPDKPSGDATTFRAVQQAYEQLLVVHARRRNTNGGSIDGGSTNGGSTGQGATAAAGGAGAAAAAARVPPVEDARPSPIGRWVFRGYGRNGETTMNADMHIGRADDADDGISSPSHAPAASAATSGISALARRRGALVLRPSARDAFTLEPFEVCKYDASHTDWLP